MNALILSVSFFCEETLLAPAHAILTFSPNRLYPAHDHVLSAAVLSDRPFIATVLSDRSPTEDNPSLEPWRSVSGRSTMNSETMRMFLQ